jgi:MFS family permease
MHEADPKYYGRVMSITMMAWGFNGLAGLPFGYMADGFGERQTLAVMGVLVFVVTGFVMAWLGAIGRRTPVEVGAEPAAAAGGGQ